MAEEDPDQESTANSTLSRMLAGNRRFAEGHSEHPWQDMQTRESLIDGRTPTRRYCHAPIRASAGNHLRRGAR